MSAAPKEAPKEADKRDSHCMNAHDTSPGIENGRERMTDKFFWLIIYRALSRGIEGS